MCASVKGVTDGSIESVQQQPKLYVTNCGTVHSGAKYPYSSPYMALFLYCVSVELLNIVLIMKL